MASLALAPSLDFENADGDDASPSRGDRKKHHAQQDGDDGDSGNAEDTVHESSDNGSDDPELAGEKVRTLAQCFPPRLGDNNQQEDEPKSAQVAAAATCEPQLQRLGTTVEPHAAPPTARPQNEPPGERREIERLKQANQDLAQQLKDLKVQYGRHIHSMRAEQQQRNAAHDRSEREWKLQTELLQRSRIEAVDDWRRAQAQVEMLHERLAQLETPVDEAESANSPPRQQAELSSPLRLTQQHGHLATSNQHPHRHTVNRSVVGASRANAPHVTCHQSTARSDAITVRATRLGRDRSAPAGNVTVETGGYSPPLAATRLQPPPVVPFQLRDSHSERSFCHHHQPARSAPSPARSYAEYAHQELVGMLGKQDSLDVEQGFSPPRQHAVPHERQRQEENGQRTPASPSSPNHQHQ